VTKKNVRSGLTACTVITDHTSVRPNVTRAKTVPQNIADQV